MFTNKNMSEGLLRGAGMTQTSKKAIPTPVMMSNNLGTLHT